MQMKRDSPRVTDSRTLHDVRTVSIDHELCDELHLMPPRTVIRAAISSGIGTHGCLTLQYSHAQVKLC